MNHLNCNIKLCLILANLFNKTIEINLKMEIKLSDFKGI